MIKTDPEEYIKDPCRAASLPFWKAESYEIPAHIAVFREDAFDSQSCKGRDEPYFKMVHSLNAIISPILPEGYLLTTASPEEYAAHINQCYDEESVTAEELEAYTKRAVYDASLWFAVRESGSGRIVASGIGEMDKNIREGILDWIQVSPDSKRKGLGRFVVCELLRRMAGRANFVTVSGRLNNPDNPLALYRSCGFENPVIWHVVES